MKNEILFIFTKILTIFFLLKNGILSGAKVCISCRSRTMLKNEYLVAKIGVDKAENEPLKVWKKIQFIIHSPPQSYQVHGLLSLRNTSCPNMLKQQRQMKIEGIRRRLPVQRLDLCRFNQIQLRASLSHLISVRITPPTPLTPSAP